MQFIKKLRQNTFILGSYKYNSNEPIKPRRAYQIGTISSISDKEFIGAYHCLDEDCVYSAMNPNTSETYCLKILKIDEKRDIVKFSIADKKVRNTWLEMSNNFSKKGDNIYIYGYPKENGTPVEKYKGKLIEAKVVSSGIFEKMRNRGYILIFDKIVLGGYSGSPILNKEGLLVGVVRGDIYDDHEFEGCSIGICL